MIYNETKQTKKTKKQKKTWINFDMHIQSPIFEIRGSFCTNNSFSTSGDFCRLLITFANSLDPVQARQNVGPDLDPNCLVL